jgi:hexosaminidase
MKYTVCILTIVLFFWVLLLQAQPLHIIPRPIAIDPLEGDFEFNQTTAVCYPSDSASWMGFAQDWVSWINPSYGLSVTLQPCHNISRSARKSSVIQLLADEAIAHPEGYRLEVRPGRIVIRARSGAGAFYALQTLRQLLPVKPEPQTRLTVPGCLIVDAPRFTYRGMHLDVGRHFFSVEFIKRYIDLMAQHKLNTFHWHLTEDQGWRMPIASYPALATVAACRDRTLVGHYNDQPWQFDNKPYCGQYTPEALKEVIDYARRRYVTIIPEIEMPGHSTAALAAYPELGCTGGPYSTLTVWGISDEVFCAGNDQTFVFLEAVLDDVCRIFPGPYVHIGGDECPKTRWKNCSKCQSRMRAEGLADEHELQSWFIRKIGDMLASRQKRLIGWDEILEGGLAPNATVMSWRGTEGGITAVRSGHEAIMTPGSHCYFDHYQGDPASEPLAIGGYTTIEKVYAYEPVPDGLTDEEAKRILGAQANVWTEYMPTPEKVEYMAYPRACALSEVLWTPAGQKRWPDFAERLKTHLGRLDAQNLNYAASVFQVIPSWTSGQISLRTAYPDLDIRYTLDGTDPDRAATLYQAPFLPEESVELKARAFSGNQALGPVSSVRYLKHLATGKPYSMTHLPEHYTGGERYALTNGVTGGLRTWNNWVGLAGKDIDPVIDLGTVQPVEAVQIQYVDAKGSWIWPPRSVALSISSDGIHFSQIAEQRVDEAISGNVVGSILLEGLKLEARYVRVVATSFGRIPDGFPGEGNGAWLFMDEIIIR